MTNTPQTLACDAYDAALLAAVAATALHDAAQQVYVDARDAYFAADAAATLATAVYDAAGPLLDAARSAYYASKEA